MPTALNTTKRKFHRILDSISNASSTSLTTSHGKHNASTITLPATMDPPVKKVRLARPTSAYMSPNTRILVAPELKNRHGTVSKQPPASSASAIEEHKSPNFAPWDRAQFLERLKTYRHVDKWTGKPEKINEVQWAKRGWSCVGRETVGCVGGCERELVIRLKSSEEDKENEEGDAVDEEADDQEWRKEAEEQLADKYAEMIITSHDCNCLWRRRGCDDSIQRLSLARRAVAIDNLRQRYQSLLAMASELPTDPSMPEGFDLPDIYACMLPLVCSTSSNTPQDAQISTNDSSNPTHNAASPLPLITAALTLALFGWQAEEGHISGLATCKACFRRLGLWLFKTPPDPSIGSSMDRLDVIGEHRDYCPWINALSQSGTTSEPTSLDGLAGWEVLLRAVSTDTQKRRDTSNTISNVATIDSEDVASEVGSISSSALISGDRKDEEERDKERWAKLKRLKQVFHVKKGRKRETILPKSGNVPG